VSVFQSASVVALTHSHRKIAVAWLFSGSPSNLIVFFHTM